uniref:C2 domain-containing protein n=1 Tax=Alexandrium catenella TaxID=2925 RepID=A0A7S1LNZ3_ALECA|mmetsp:Transcript_117605/g.312874  ORF Transcript_117605/g.312874 Transcript_117605/m.312874 type:complete len:136 (+) Transcript_117605:83-490(+)
MSQIQIQIVNGMDLPNMDGLDKTDGYVKVTMGGTEVMKTKVINNNLNPVWNATATVKWDGINDLIFTVWDSDLFTRDDWIGQYILSKGHIRAGFKGTVPLNVGKKVKKGSASTHPSIQIKVAPPDSGCCGGCSVM